MALGTNGDECFLAVAFFVYTHAHTRLLQTIDLNESDCDNECRIRSDARLDLNDKPMTLAVPQQEFELGEVVLLRKDDVLHGNPIWPDMV